VVGSCEYGNEPSGYVEGEEFFDYLSDLASQEVLYRIGLFSWLVSQLVCLN